MAQDAPSSIDVQDVQFKLHDKFSLFNAGTGGLRSHVDLLAPASSYGLLFAGNPNAPEIKVIILKELVDAQTSGKKLHARTVPLPNVPNALACSADGSFLAVNYTLNGSGFLQIYSVASFTTPNIKSLYNIRLSPEENVFALQLLWNPVLTANLAVVLSNGALGMYTLKEGGHFELHSLERTHQVRCGCWSPKGKQIVLGFPNGKLQQFKPDLTPAKTIACPAGVQAGPFDTIALHWLSTFQFAAVFLQQGVDDASPGLYIVNAPKGGTPTFINYYDICYSSSGPRAHQVSFTHIPPWNLLLVTSANGVELGLLGTKEATDTPTWLQYTLLDEARIEMPLTEAKDETFPIGFAFDTSSSHQLTIGEVKMPVSPMVHVLSTHGHLVSFDFLNLSPGAVGVCSPPPPLTDTSGQFRPLDESNANAAAASGVAKSQEPVAATTRAVAATTADMSFGFAPSAVTSTPAVKEKPTSMFGAFAATATAAPVSTSAPSTMFGQVASSGVTFGASSTTNKATHQSPAAGFGLTATTGSSSVPQFGALANTTASVPSTTTTGFSGFGGLSAGGGSTTFAGFGANVDVGSAAPVMSVPAQAQQKQQQITSTGAQKPNEINKPLYTVPATFTPPASTASLPQQQQQHQQQQQQQQYRPSAAKPQMNTGEINEVVKQMIAVQINAFDLELKQLANQSKGLLANIGNPDEMKAGTRRLNDLQEIVEQANDRDFEQDVQNLRHSLNESYAMLAECRSKLEMYNNPDITRLTSMTTFDPVNRRQLAKLQSYLAANQTQMQQLQQQIDAQWSGYQDLMRRNSRKQMHIPCLDGIYQRMTKLKDMVARQRTKINYIKGKLKQNGLIYKPPNTADATATNARPETSMESLADSILSMSLVHVVEANRSKMSDAKLNAIRNFTRRQQQITIIKPQRPDRVDLKSEVILETKLQSDRRARDGAATSLLKMQQEKLHPKTQHQQQQTAALESSHMTQLAKPMATKPAVAPVQPQTTFAPPAQAQMGGAPSFNLGGSSVFVKTSSSASASATAASAVNKFGAEEQQPKQPFSIASSIGNTFTTPTFTGFGGVVAGGNSNAHQQQQQPLSFGGQPKTKPDSLKEALAAPPLQTPISFSPKVIGGGDVAKPFAVVSNASSSSLNAPTVSSGFAALTATNATKSTGSAAAAAQPPPPIVKDKENKKPEEAPKAFSFNSEVSTSVATPTFGGFAVPAASTAAASTTKSSFFGGEGSSTFSFGGLGTTAASGTSAAAPAAFSFGGAVSAASSTAPTTAVSSLTAPVTASAAKTPMFSGFGKSVGEANVAKPAAATNSGFNFGGALNLTTSPTSTSAPSTSTGTAATKTTATSTAGATANSTSDPTDSLFGTLNICKPNAAKDAVGDGVKTTTANVFSGFGDGSAFSFNTPAAGPGGDTSIFAAAAASTGSSGFSFGAAASSFGKPAAATTVATTTTATTTAAATSTAATSTAASVIPSTSTTTATTKASTAEAPPTATAFSFTAMAGLGTSSATAAPTSASSTASTATTAPSIFGSTANSVFGASAAPTTAAGLTTAATLSIFGSTAAPAAAFGSVTSTAAATTAPTASIFASTAATATTAAPLPSASAGNIFSSAATVTAAAPASGGNIFGGGGGMPKPDQSVFGSESSAAPAVASGVGLFAAAAAASSLPFGSPTAAPAASGGSIFGGSSSGFGVATSGSSATGGSIFGGGGASASNTAPPSPFGAAAAPAGGGSIFGGAAAPAGGGSIFGQSAFGTATSQPSTGGSNIFAAAAAQPNAASTGFGGGGNSLFGGTASNATSGGSIFGGASSAPAFGAPASTGFGAFSQQAAAAAPAFGAPNAAAGGFAQGGASVGQSGFGSPQSGPTAAASAFAKPVFGGNASFGGSPPAFGGQPSFGGAPTFGSPKPFGSFTSPVAAVPQQSPFGSPPSQKNTLFEALGSNESGGLSFGNLAQNTSANAQKPTFGGSSFMNYRA